MTNARVLTRAAILAGAFGVALLSAGMAQAAVDDEAAYQTAIAAGTAAALRDFIVSHPDSPLLEQAFAELNRICAESPDTEGCDLEGLILPAAGDTPPAGPTSGPGGKGDASPG